MTEWWSVPRPTAGAGAAELPEPGDGQIIDLTRAAAGEFARQAARRSYLSRSA
jgi:hypothetical protein